MERDRDDEFEEISDESRKALDRRQCAYEVMIAQQVQFAPIIEHTERLQREREEADRDVRYWKDRMEQFLKK